MATHYSILAWKIPWTGGLQSVGLQRVGHKLATKHQKKIMYYVAAAAKSLKLCPTLCDPMDCSLPRSSVHGIFQARVLEWGAIAFSVTPASNNQNRMIWSVILPH